jgi:hypothetical protein
VNLRPLRSPCLGVTVSSWSVRDQPAERPLTLIERTVRPTKSRLKLDRFRVALAEMVATPTSRSVAGS